MSFDRFYSARSYDMVLPPNGQQRLDVTGDSIKLLTSNGLVRIETDTGVLLDCLPGQGFRRDYGHLRFTDMTGASNPIKVFAGAGDMIDDRVSGDVTVNDWDAAKIITLENRAFASAILATTSGADNALVQLWNPPGSGKRLVLEHWRTATLNAATQLVISGIVTAQIGGFGGSVNSNHADGLVHTSVGQLKADHGLYPSFVGGIVSMYDLAPLLVFADTLLKKPFVIEPGNGYSWVGNAVGLNVVISMNWYEETIQ